jgi:hypothetical protein
MSIAPVARIPAKGLRTMSTKVSAISGVAFLLAAVAFSPTNSAKADGSKAAQQRRSEPEITGAIDTRAGGLAGVAAAAAASTHAGAARMRFFEARAAMERSLRLSDGAGGTQIAILDASMKSLFRELTAIEQIEQSAASAKEARRLADDWYQAGLKIVAPPANGITELPLPMLMSKKAEAVAAGLDLLVEESAANAAPKSVQIPKLRPSSRKFVALLQPQPVTQNQASLRLMRESLPLFFPIVGNVVQSSRQSAVKKQ